MTQNVSPPPEGLSAHAALPLSGIFCIYCPETPSPGTTPLHPHSKPGGLKSSFGSQQGYPVLRKAPQSSLAFG